MATFDYTTAANQTGWQNGVQVKSWTIDFEDFINTKGMVDTGADQIRLMAIPADSSMVVLSGTVRVDRIYVGTSCTLDIGVDGSDVFDANCDTKVAAGTITAIDATVPYVVAESTSVQYVTAEITEGANDTTDAGKVTITLCYFISNN